MSDKNVKLNSETDGIAALPTDIVVIPIVTTLFVCFLISIISFLSIKMAHDGTPLYETPIWVVLVFGLLLFWSIPVSYTHLRAHET